MADANCKIHGTPFNGFGNFTFCNECDAENEARAEYESDKPDTLEDGYGNTLTKQPTVASGTGTLAGLLDDDKYGWLVFHGQQHIQQKGHVRIAVGTPIELNRPEYHTVMGAIYRVKLDDYLKKHTVPHMNRVLRVVSEPTAYIEQWLKCRDGREYIGEVDVGPWDCPDP